MHLDSTLRYVLPFILIYLVLFCECDRQKRNGREPVLVDKIVDASANKTEDQGTSVIRPPASEKNAKSGMVNGVDNGHHADTKQSGGNNSNLPINKNDGKVGTAPSDQAQVGKDTAGIEAPKEKGQAPAIKADSQGPAVNKIPGAPQMEPVPIAKEAEDSGNKAKVVEENGNMAKEPIIDANKSPKIDAAKLEPPQVDDDDAPVVPQPKADAENSEDDESNSPKDKDKNIPAKDDGSDPKIMVKDVPAVGKQAVLPRMPSDDEPESSHFMGYLLTFSVLCIAAYVLAHNRHKLMALILEGRSGKRRQRSVSGSGRGVRYKRLEADDVEGENGVNLSDRDGGRPTRGDMVDFVLDS